MIITVRIVRWMPCKTFCPEVGSRRKFGYILVSFAACDANKLLDASSITQGLGVFHVLCNDLVKSAADGCDGVVRHALSHTATTAVIVASWQAVDQVSHGVLAFRGAEGHREREGEERERGAT